MNPDATVLLALALDAAFGEPAWLYARVPHPVVFFGRLVGLLDRTLNRETATRFARRLSGIAAVILLVTLTAGPAWLLSWGLSVTPWGWVVEAILASTLIAQQSLYTHVAAVASALETEGLAGGRRAVSMIVGRNPESLDEQASAAPPSSPAPRTSPTASWPRYSGSPSLVSPALSPTRRSTRRTA